MQQSLPQISIKRAYEAPDISDGTRVLIDRLWPRGVRKADLEIAVWLKNVAPSSALRKWFDHDPAKWTVFQEKYLTELHRGNDEISSLLNLARSEKITLIYGAHDKIHNHAQVLRQFLNQTLSALEQE
ncbi:MULTISPECIES: DUF488 domain-containing protein [Asaia]|uniref:DUF488 domain-containing protein n=1 Tax=Asaia TaxID=91914 RepID=UPI0025577C95|nr:DUF488 domain-containing protein [Asaia sp. HumB]MDL2170847.1 DUF488 domain-containing protein [Asaia sp. HumB]